MHEAVCVDVASMHSNRQIIPLKQSKCELFIFNEVDALGYLRYLQFFQT